MFGWVNHLGAEPGTQVYLSSEAGWMITRRNLGEEIGTSRDTPARIRGFAVFADAWLKTG